jgi:ankyrin repeat protein
LSKKKGSSAIDALFNAFDIYESNNGIKESLRPESAKELINLLLDTSEIKKHVCRNINKLAEETSLLHHAVDHGMIDVAAKLITLGADVNMVNGFGETPLYLAIHQKEGCKTIDQAKSHIEMAEILLRNGAAHSEKIHESSTHVGLDNLRQMIKDLSRKEITPRATTKRLSKAVQQVVNNTNQSEMM